MEEVRTRVCGVTGFGKTSEQGGYSRSDTHGKCVTHRLSLSSELLILSLDNTTAKATREYGFFFLFFT